MKAVKLTLLDYTMDDLMDVEVIPLNDEGERFIKSVQDDVERKHHYDILDVEELVEANCLKLKDNG